jgi:hypothetical protein
MLCPSGSSAKGRQAARHHGTGLVQRELQPQLAIVAVSAERERALVGVAAANVRATREHVVALNGLPIRLRMIPADK